LATWWPVVADFNLLMAETDTEGDITVPVAEWLSSIRTPSQMSSSRKACLLFDLYLDKDVFHRVSFEIIYRSADTETAEKRLLFSVSNDGVTDRVKDVFEFSLDYAVSHYQVTASLIVSQVTKLQIPMHVGYLWPPRLDNNWRTHTRTHTTFNLGYPVSRLILIQGVSTSRMSFLSPNKQSTD